MSLERICSKTVVTISPDATVLEAAKLMHSKHIGSLVVIDDSRPIGILTDRDIVLKVVASEEKPVETAVKKIMTANPTMVNVNYDLLDAVRLMRNRGVRRLPIVDEHRHLLGIITMDDLLTAFSAEVGDLAGAVQKEFGLEAAGTVAS
ncbi:MAG TPA: CBS domain-containing protein [Candidatus Binatia bacterium]|jgi:CBS domain-containing protein|nr:CBS domain-containing protein [Candidatus Binatia bacterium]